MINEVDIKMLPYSVSFYNTSASITRLIEAPPIEALHTAMVDNTFQNIAKAVKAMPNPSHDDFANIFTNMTHLDEKLVHALSILWLRRYLVERNFGLEPEFRERFESYETEAAFRGTNRMAQYIAGKGIGSVLDFRTFPYKHIFKMIHAF